MPTGKTEPTVTLERPTGATPIPQGQPLDKAENSRGAKVLTEQAKGVSDSKDIKRADTIPEMECKTLIELIS